MTNKQMWEILVPTMFNDGTPIRTRYHKVWDKKVYEITGGLTIHLPTKGKWVNPVDGELFQERMIPVRIACTREQIDKIIDVTMDYYKQLAILAYKVSDEVIIKYISERT